MIPSVFSYRAKVDRVIDGDTIVMMIDLGFHMTAKVSIRLYGVDTPELRSRDAKEKEAARNARAFTEVWCNEAVGNPKPSDEWADWPFVVTTSKSDSFGRWLGYVWSVRTGAELNQAIIDAGYPVRAGK
jgi:micrococcal nuclease